MKTAMQQLLEEVILEREKSISVEFRDALDFVITAIKTDFKEMEKEQQLELIQFLSEKEDFKEHSSMSVFIAEDYLNQFKNK